MIGADQLAQLRAAAGTLCSDTATRGQAGTPVRQPGGGFTLASTPGPPFPCTLAPLTRQAAEGLISAETVSRPHYWLYYPVGIVLTAQDTVTIAGRVYQIEAVLDANADALLSQALVWRNSE